MSASLHDIGEWLAGLIAQFLGSWRYLILQTVLVVAWITANAWLLRHPFDPMPFILLNLAFSTQASYAAPLLQLSANRMQRADRLRDDREAAEVEHALVLEQQQIEKLDQILAYLRDQAGD